MCSRFYCLRIECAVDQAVGQVLLLARVEQLPLMQLLSSKQWAKLSIFACWLDSAEPFAGVLCYAGLKLASQGVVIELASNQHQLVLALSGPVAVINGEALAG